MWALRLLLFGVRCSNSPSCETGTVDRARQRYPTHAETNKTPCQHLSEIPRQRIRREVCAASAAATNAGLLLRLRTEHSDHVTGYSVALSAHHTAASSTIWYSGHALGQDPSLTKVRGQWCRGTG
jgi:hypothetical protein